MGLYEQLRNLNYWKILSPETFPRPTWPRTRVQSTSSLQDNLVFAMEWIIFSFRNGFLIKLMPLQLQLQFLTSLTFSKLCAFILTFSTYWSKSSVFCDFQNLGSLCSISLLSDLMRFVNQVGILRGMGWGDK